MSNLKSDLPNSDDPKVGQLAHTVTNKAFEGAIAEIFAALAGGAISYFGVHMESLPPVLKFVVVIVGMGLAFGAVRFFQVVRARWQRSHVVTKGRKSLNGLRVRLKHCHPAVRFTITEALADLATNLLDDTQTLWTMHQYITFLGKGLQTRPTAFFATCTITPEEWYGGSSSSLIKGYFDQQREYIKKYPTCEMYRVLLVSLDKLKNSDGKYTDTTIKWVTDHANAGIRYGWVDPGELEKVNSEFMRDFALFRDDHGAWIVEAHGKVTHGKDDFVNVQIRDGNQSNRLEVACHEMLDRCCGLPNIHTQLSTEENRLVSSHTINL